jgi:hypothetical protein
VAANANAATTMRPTTTRRGPAGILFTRDEGAAAGPEIDKQTVA